MLVNYLKVPSRGKLGGQVLLRSTKLAFQAHLPVQKLRENLCCRENPWVSFQNSLKASQESQHLKYASEKSCCS